jgi:ribosomal protein S12 methylthiotransferase accessory factor
VSTTLSAPAPDLPRDGVAAVDLALRSRLLDADVQLTPRVGLLGASDAFRAAGEPDQPAGPVVPVHLYGASAVVGPVETPSTVDDAVAASGPLPPCGGCLARRWQALRHTQERRALERGSGRVGAIAGSPFGTGFALDTLAALCRHAVTGGPSPLPPGHAWVYELRLDTLRVTPRLLLADGGCPRCGTPPPACPQPPAWAPAPQPKRSPEDTRLRSVHEYDLLLEAYANPLCGALGPGAMPALDSPTTAPVTGAMWLPGPYGYADFYWSGHADRFDDSAVLGVLEGLERQAGLASRGPAGRIVDSYRNLAGQALDPRDCGVYSDEAYRMLARMHRPFDPDAPINWVWGYSLRDDQPILVPEQIVYYGRTLVGEPGFVMECSNGCASGSSLEEAVLHGLFELIERDAFLLTWFGKARLPEIDPDSCTRADTVLMVDRVRRYGYDVRLFDSRIDLPVPVVTAVGVRRDGGLGRLCFAAGAGLDPEDAVQAALCETASYVPGFPERIERSIEEARSLAADFTRIHELRQHALVYGLPQMAGHADFLLGAGPVAPMSTVYAEWQRERPRHADLRADVGWIRDRLVAAGFDVIVVDQTSAEQRRAGLHTACVVVPGLLPIDFGWWRQRAPHMSRTRTAFRRAGWRGTDLDPVDLNRAPHPFP